MTLNIKDISQQDIIDWLNRNIKKPPHYIHDKEVCITCNENICQCCGQEIDCPYFQEIEKCPYVRKEMAISKKRFGKFKPDQLKVNGEELPAFINEPRMIAVTHVQPIERFERLYDVKYKKIKQPILKVKTLWKEDTLCLVGEGKQAFNECEKYPLYNLLRIAREPNFYFAEGNPLILMNEDYAFLLALRGKDKYDPETYEDYANWIPYQRYKMIRYIYILSHWL